MVVVDTSPTHGAVIRTSLHTISRGAALLAGVLAAASLTTTAAQAHGSFYDDDGNHHEDNIQAVAEAGYTEGCDVDRYCPDEVLPRDQMASLLARALDLPPAESDHFTDDDGNTHEDAINRLHEAGVTEGCAEGRYCPEHDLARDQMASLLARALDLPPAASDHFTDDDGNTHEENINRIEEAGITEGCATDRYCPDEETQRDQMASFLARAFDRSHEDPTTGFDEVIRYALDTEGDPAHDALQVFAHRVHDALHGVGSWNISDRILFLRDQDEPDVHIVLTDDDEVGEKAPVCSDEWSCTVGDRVYINDENFAHGTDSWEHRSIVDYQLYVINHEMGHWLDFDHTAEGDSHYNDPARCEPAYDGDAPVMMQQSIDTRGCDTNVWPLGFERDCVEETWLADGTTQSEECPHQP